MTAFDPVVRLTDPAFIAANREGRLASRQESRLGDGAYRSRFERVAGSIAAVGVAAAASLSTSRLEGASDAERLTVYAVCAVIVGLAAVVLRPWADPLGADLRSGVVERVTGTPTSEATLRRLGRDAWRAGYRVTIGGLPFAVPAWIWAAVDDARTVTAYYLPRSMTLVSIEAADERDQPPILPIPSRRAPVRTERAMAVASVGAVGLGLVVRAFLPPVELVPEIPAALLCLGVAGALFLRS